MRARQLFTLLTALYPPHSRAFRRDMIDFMEARHARAVRGGHPVRFWVELVADTVAALLAGWADYLLEGGGKMGMRIGTIGRVALHESGLRFLRRRKAAAAMVVLTVALALGANNVAFAVLDAFLLSSFGIADPDRVMVVSPHRDLPGVGVVPFAEAWPNYRLVRETTRSFESVTAMTQTTLSWDDGLEARALDGARVTASFFATTGVAPLLGRAIAPQEEGPSPARVVLLSHALWQGAFSGESGILGRTMVLDGLAHEIIGVMPPGFQRPLPSDVWLPIDLQPTHWERILGARTITMYGRLAEGTSKREAAAEMEELTTRALEASADNQGFAYRLLSLREQELPRADRAILFVQVGSLMLLLLALLNFGVVLIAWGVDRRQEMAVRLALGASAGRVALGLLFQGVALVLAASLCGLTLASFALPAIGQLDVHPAIAPYLGNVGLNGRVFAVGGGLTLFAGLAAAAVPAWLGRRTAIGDSLRSGSRSSGLGPTAVRAQRAMLALQTTFAVVLLTGAGSFALSFRNLAAVPTGFDSEGRVVARVQLSADGYPTHDDRASFGRRLEEALAEQPEVARAGYTTVLPIGEGNSVGRFVASPEEADPSRDPPPSNVRRISPGYLAAMDIPILEGRGFEVRDDASSTLVAIVSRTAANRLWPGEDPIGRPLYWAVPDGEPRRLEVVGVAADVMLINFDQPPGQTVYMPFAQSSGTRLSVVIEARSELEGATAALRRALATAAPGLAASNVVALASLERQVSMVSWLQSTLVSVFAVIALCIALLGTYGVMSQLVASRQRDHAVRLAFGALPRRIAASVVGSAAAVALPGVLLGLGASWFVSERFLGPILFEVGESASVVRLGVAGVMLLLVILATLPPALRAARVRASVGVGPG